MLVVLWVVDVVEWVLLEELVVEWLVVLWDVVVGGGGGDQVLVGFCEVEVV